MFAKNDDYEEPQMNQWPQSSTFDQVLSRGSFKCQWDIATMIFLKDIHSMLFTLEKNEKLTCSVIKESNKLQNRQSSTFT